MSQHDPLPIHGFLEDAASRGGDSLAVIEDGDTLTYAELLRRARSVADVLTAEGLDGMRVAVLAENSTGYVVLYWGILLAGGSGTRLLPATTASWSRSRRSSRASGPIA